MKNLIAFGAAAVILTGAAVADSGHHARRNGAHEGLHSERMLERMTDQLELTNEQQEQVATLLEVQRDATQPIFAEIRTLGEELETRLDTGGVSAAEIGELVLEIHELRQQVRSGGEEFRAELETLLTPEQIEVLPTEDRIEGRHKIRRRGFRGPRGGINAQSEAPAEAPTDF